MQHAAGNIKRITRFDRQALHDAVVLFSQQRFANTFTADAGFDARQAGSPWRCPQNMPGFRLAVWLLFKTLCRVIVGVQMHRQHAGAVNKFSEQRKLRATPAGRDQRIGFTEGQLAQGFTGQWAVFHRRVHTIDVTDFPGFCDTPIGQVRFAEFFFDQTAAENMKCHRQSQLYRMGFHYRAP